MSAISIKVRAVSPVLSSPSMRLGSSTTGSGWLPVGVGYSVSHGATLRVRSLGGYPSDAPSRAALSTDLPSDSDASEVVMVVTGIAHPWGFTPDSSVSGAVFR